MNGNIKGKLTSAYFELVIKEVRATMPLEDDEDRHGLGEAIINVVRRSGPTVISKKTTRRDKFIANKIFRPMGEILRAMWAIENIAIYVRAFPHKKQSVSPLSYLRYHVENYLNEIYILNTRLISYLNALEKAYSKSEQGREISKKLTPLYSIVSDVFKPYTKARGSHVHVARFSDEEIDRLSTLDLLSKAGDDFGHLMKSIFLSSYRASRKKWADKIVKDSIAIQKLLDVYFGELTKALFRDEHLIIPENYK